MEQEKRWIRAAQKLGSRTAAERIVRRYYDEMYAFAYRQTGSKEDALDLVQSIFVAMLRSLPHYDARKASFRTWLYRIATNKVIDARRKARSTPVPLGESEELEKLGGIEGELIADEGDLAAEVGNRELLGRIESYVSGFDAHVQAAFRLRLFGERTFPEIAAILNRPEPAVKAQYYRLLTRIRKEFDLHE